MPQLWIGITRPFFIRFWRFNKFKFFGPFFGPRPHIGSIWHINAKPPSSCWYISWPLPPTHSSKSIFQKFLAWTPPLKHGKFIQTIFIYKIILRWTVRYPHPDSVSNNNVHSFQNCYKTTNMQPKWHDNQISTYLSLNLKNHFSIPDIIVDIIRYILLLLCGLCLLVLTGIPVRHQMRIDYLVDPVYVYLYSSVLLPVFYSAMTSLK